MSGKKFKLLVGIPTINRADLLNEALAHYFEDFASTEIVICDNGNQDIITREKMFVIYRPPQNLGVAGSWNMIMDYADRLGFTHVLMLNDDIMLGRTGYEINLLIEQNLEVPFINSYQNWCSFILRVDAWKQVGGFDTEFFPAYFEDNSFCYKMRLQNMERVHTFELNPLVYRNSMTIAKEPSLNNNFMRNRQVYIDMWGGLPNEEKYITKYNKI
jgi:GT2 family glycosyltransferase